jgi:tripartite motif-containing protein 71
MTTPENEIHVPPTPTGEKEERKRRALLLILLLMLLAICAAGCLFLRYILKPEPITDIVPLPIAQQAPPTFVKMISGVDHPVGVAVSPDAQRIYVVEGEGELLIKIFDRDGNLIKSFSPPLTSNSTRSYGYIAVAPNGYVFLTERYNRIIDIFDADGNFIDGIIGKNMTLTKFLKTNAGVILIPGMSYSYDNINKVVVYTNAAGELIAVPGPDNLDWDPLGLRFDAEGNLMVTNLAGNKDEVMIYPAQYVKGDWQAFSPTFQEFGTEGNLAGQFAFPQVVVRDDQGNYYVSDGNNGRISTWSVDRIYKTFFGFGSSEQTLNLPRGMWMDGKNHLHVVDSVGSAVRVYDVSGKEPAFLFNFGESGVSEGFLNFPTDICIDSTGRVYIADSQNNRIDIWSY